MNRFNKIKTLENSKKEIQKSINRLEKSLEKELDTYYLRLSKWIRKNATIVTVKGKLLHKKGTVEYGGVHDDPMCDCKYIYKEDHFAPEIYKVYIDKKFIEECYSKPDYKYIARYSKIVQRLYSQKTKEKLPE